MRRCQALSVYEQEDVNGGVVCDSLGSGACVIEYSHSSLFCSSYPLIEENNSKSIIVTCYMLAK